MGKIKSKIEYILKSSDLYNREALSEGDSRHPVSDNLFHMNEAIGWIKRAQDAFKGGGVARGYSVAWNHHFNGKDWQPPYPETTGYIIPTFFDCAAFLDDKDLADRALKMAAWEIDIQMRNGAVQGGTTGDKTLVPSVFCTGQVMFGWLRAYKESGDEKFMNAAVRSGDYLLSVQDAHGRLVEDANYVYANKETTAYHTRVAWALVLLGTIGGNKAYVEAGRKNIEFNLGLQESNGWFRNNCLWDANQPLLHTICYAIRGVLESGLLLRNEQFIKAAKLPSDRLLEVCSGAEFPPGRFDRNWKSTVDWSCLTGDAQLAIIWLKLYQITGEKKYLDGAGKLICFVKSTQNCTSANPGLRGGIKGSYPFGGQYGKYQILNWANKFFIDALLLDSRVKQNQ